MYTERTQQFLRKKKSYLKKPKRLEGLRPRNTSAAPAIATSASTTTTARVWPSVVATIVVMADPIIFQWLFFLNLKIKLIKKENTKNSLTAFSWSATTLSGVENLTVPLTSVVSTAKCAQPAYRRRWADRGWRLIQLR